MISSPRAAATVVVMRDSLAGPPEVFLLKRHGQASFMGGAHVFPGGAVDPSDSSPDLAGACGENALENLGHLCSEVGASAATAILVCAAREVFEESGLLLAYGSRSDASRDALVDLNGDFAVSAAAARQKLIAGQGSFAALVSSHGLVLAIDRLAYFAHWITPEIEPKRFDARFFMAVAPRDQHAGHDRAETTASVWLSPAAAIDCYEAGEIVLAPPTLVVLDRLAHFDSAAAAFAALRATAAVPPVMPKLLAAASSIVLLLPGDPEYGDGHVAAVAGEPVRIELCDRKWRLLRA
ncbi:MAG: NUDIX hydrolase [Candidatus Schekmanbacteria bacterium]|nr:NUDIX hydrolase [Candidatus Schekmanbacteria bacterium]